MKSWVHNLRRFLCAGDGPTATEYGVLLALIALAAVSALALFGEHMENIYLALNATLQVF